MGVSCIRAQRRTGERWHSFLPNSSVWQNGVWEKGFRGSHKKNGMVLCFIVSVLVFQPLFQDGVMATFKTEAMLVLQWYHPVLVGNTPNKYEKKKLLCAGRKSMLRSVGEANKCRSGLQEAF